MKQTTKTWMCGAAALVLAAGAQAQTPLPLLAPGFETPNPLSPASPNQFNNNGNTEIRRVDSSVVAPHSGNWCVIMEAPTDNGFAGMTTDSRNFFAAGFPFFDVAYDYNGGDILMTAWYMIPANAPVNFDRDPTTGLVLGGAPSGIKINIKGAADPNQDNATLDPWGVEGPYAQNLVFGTTNGQWRQLSFRFTQADIHNQVEVVNGFILPPNPNRAKITIGRFAYGLPNATGVVYWDDITFEQVPPLGGCRADFNGDGFIDPDDLSDYIACFFAMPPCDRGDFNGDGFTDPDDLSDYIALFFGGC